MNIHEYGEGNKQTILLNKKIYDVKKDGFYGVWYPCPRESHALVIIIHKVCVGRIAEGPAEWFHQQGLHVLVLDPRCFP